MKLGDYLFVALAIIGFFAAGLYMNSCAARQLEYLPEDMQQNKKIVLTQPEEISKVVKLAEQPVWQTFECTAYTSEDEGCNNITLTGFELTPGARVVAVDPKIIPYGSVVEIYGYGTFYAEDCGGAIKSNRLDVWFESYEDAIAFGRRNLKIRWK